jgi:hypothetical protein
VIGALVPATAVGERRRTSSWRISRFGRSRILVAEAEVRPCSSLSAAISRVQEMWRRCLRDFAEIQHRGNSVVAEVSYIESRAPWDELGARAPGFEDFVGRPGAESLVRQVLVEPRPVRLKPRLDRSEWDTCRIPARERKPSRRHESESFRICSGDGEPTQTRT